jgi:hypothetical protein
LGLGYDPLFIASSLLLTKTSKRKTECVFLSLTGKGAMAKVILEVQVKEEEGRNGRSKGM